MTDHDQDGGARSAAGFFDPHEDLAHAILKRSGILSHDGAHDLSHLVRVWRNAGRIMAVEGGDPVVVLAGVLLHDLVDVPKDSPLRSEASRLSAEAGARILRGLGWDEPEVGRVSHAVEAHSFSAGIAPETLEARVLRDADRLDALGAVGVARCFMVSGKLGRPLYDVEDPMAERRPLDDVRWTLDHFPAKLLKLASGFGTGEGARLAAERLARLRRFHEEMTDEIS